MRKFLWKWLACIIVLALMISLSLSPSVPLPQLSLPSTALSQPHSSPPAHTAQSTHSLAQSDMSQLALNFEANYGQAPAMVRYLTHGLGYVLLLSEAGMTLELAAPSSGGEADTLPTKMQRPTTISLEFEGANPQPQLLGEELQTGVSNYFLGSNPQKWQTGVATYAKVSYRSIYPGIDMTWYGTNRHLEYDFVVQPHSDPTLIKLKLSGAERVTLEGGELVAQIGGHQLREAAPVVYQDGIQGREQVAAQYQLGGNDGISFRLGSYDHSRPLVIDPPLDFSTYFGGSGLDEGLSIATDTQGNIYVTGDTFSTDFYTTTGTVQGSYSGQRDAFVSKLSPDGQSLIYSTYLGGSGADQGNGIAVDSTGAAYVTGQTASTDFPIAQAAQGSYGGGSADAFALKLNPTGTALVYSTYLGGNSTDQGTSISLDGTGAAYLTGNTASHNFPTAGNPMQGSYGGGAFDAFVTRIAVDGSAFTYSSYLGGGGTDRGTGIAVNAGIYVTGETFSSNFITTTRAIQGSQVGLGDAFVTKLSADGSTALYSTYLGGSLLDHGAAIAADASGAAYVTGYTFSSNFITSTTAFQTHFGGLEDGFVAKIDTVGASPLIYSTYLGGSGLDAGQGLAIDNLGDAYVTGFSTSANFPTQNPIQGQLGGLGNAIVSELDSTGAALSFSTYLGGSAFDQGNALALDNGGNILVTGLTTSPDFLTQRPFQSQLQGLSDAFITKIGSTLPTATPTASPSNTPVNPTATPSATASPSDTPIAATSTPIASATAGLATDTPQPSATLPTTTTPPSPTLSPVATDTPGGPTLTPAPATATPLPTDTPASATDTPLPTDTPGGPTDTPLPTDTPGGPTDTPMPTDTPQPTDTPPPTDTPGGPTDTPMPTNTPLPTDTPGGPTDTPLPPTLSATPLPPTNTPGGPTNTPVSLTVTPTDCPNPFIDINGDIFYNAIHYFTCRGIVLGIDPTHFYPGGVTTRGQFTRLIIKGFGMPIITPTGGPTFTDVPPGFYAYLYVESGAAAGILTGYTQEQCTHFGAVYPCYLPNRAISRAELTRLVVKAAGYPIIIPSQPTFVDVPPDYFAYRYIETAFAHLVILGVDATHFEPNRGIRRDEMCQIIYNGITLP